MFHTDVNKSRQDALTADGPNGNPNLVTRLDPSSAIVKSTALQLSIHKLVVCFLIGDLLILFACGLVPYWYLDIGAMASDSSVVQFQAIFLAGMFYLLVSAVTRSFASLEVLEPTQILPRVFLGVVLTFGVLTVIGAATKTTAVYSRLWFFSWFAATGVMIPAFRLVVATWASRLLARGACVYRAISVGIFCRALSPDKIAQQSHNKVRCIESVQFDQIEIGWLADHIRHDLVDQIYIAVPWEHAPDVMQQIDVLRHLAADIFVLPQERRASMNLIGSSKLGDQLSMQVTERPINGWDLWFKRAEDVVLAGAAVIIFAPVMLLIALALKIESPGPVIFRQMRAGFNGSVFEIWKFRSMYTSQTDQEARRQTSKDDPRVTPVGRFIRATSFDELPQFFNVLQGTMSVVGPRPHALKTSTGGKLLEEVVDKYAFRHRVKPGLTGWAQVNGLRGELDSADKLKRRVTFDLQYIDNWSLGFDLKIVLRTVLKLFYDPSAY
jgi:Undecaprenyl-phosphate glucose phosphotransferase